MSDRHGDYRDTQRRWMHKPAPGKPLGYDSRMFREGEEHGEGWFHLPDDAKAQGRKDKETLDYFVADVTAHMREPAVADEDDGEEEITLEAELAAMKRPALLKMASHLGVTFETTWTADQLRSAILTANQG